MKTKRLTALCLALAVLCAGLGVWAVTGQVRVSRLSAQVRALEAAQEELAARAQKPETAAPAQRREKQRELRMSFKEQRDYETIDARIEELNAKLAGIDAEIARNASDFVKLTELSALKEETERALGEAEERWLYLNDLAERIEAQKAK